MMYLFPLLPKLNSITMVNTPIRRFGRLLLPLSLSIMLMGCDSQSSAGDKSAQNQAASNFMIQNNVPKETAVAAQNDKVPSEDISAEDNGQSLMAAAKPEDGAQIRRTPMIAERRDDSALQATLIGDYIGMLPCSDCDGVNVTLNLFADGSVLKTSVYENSESTKVPLVESGIYRQDDVTITIVYDAKNIENYCIQDNHLVMVNDDKTLDADYTLSRK